MVSVLYEWFEKRRFPMSHRPRIYTAIIIAAFTMAVIFHSSSFASGRLFNAAEQADIDGLNAVLEQDFGAVLSAGLKADAALIGRVYENGSFSADVRLRDSELAPGFLSARQSPRSENREALRNMVLGDMSAHTAGDESSLNTRRFSMIPAMDLQVDVEEPHILYDHSDVIDIVEDVPVPPALQDNNFLGVTKEASIIAVQVLTLFNDETGGGGDLDLYVGVNSLFNPDYEQNSGLLLAGQTFIGGINWTF